MDRRNKDKFTIIILSVFRMKISFLQNTLGVTVHMAAKTDSTGQSGNVCSARLDKHAKGCVAATEALRADTQRIDFAE